VGYALVGLAIAVAALGSALPHASQWVIAAILVWAALTLVGRARGWKIERRPRPALSGSRRPQVRALRPGETYQDAVKLALVPNVPLAEVWCQRLRQNGIEAFYKARQLFPELR
jgi:hypothetical protein